MTIAWDGMLGFETGDLSEWSSVVGSASASAQAAMRGNFGMQADASLVSYGRFDFASSIKQVTIEYLLGLNDLIMADGDQFQLAQIRTDITITASVMFLAFIDGNYVLSANGRDDAGDNTGGGGFVVPRPEDYLDIRWVLKVSDGPGRNNGFMRVYLNGILQSEFANIDNDTLTLPHFRIGVTAGNDAGTSGLLYIDRVNWIAEAVDCPLSNPRIMT